MQKTKHIKTVVLLILIMVFSCTTVLANLNISLDLVTDGDIDFYTRAHTSNGDISFYFDGYSFLNNETENQITITEISRPTYYGRGTDSKSIKYSIANVFADYFYNPRTQTEEITIEPYNRLDKASLVLRRVFEHFFVTREEYRNIIQHQQNQIAQLQLDILAINDLVPQENLCESKMKIADQKGIKEFTCKGDTYYYDSLTDSFITLTKK